MSNYYPTDLLNSFCKIVQAPHLLDFIIKDPYVFASYSAVFVNLLDDQNAIKHSKKLRDARSYYASINNTSSRANGSAQQLMEHEKTLKVLNELKTQLGENVSANYAQVFMSLTSFYDSVLNDSGNPTVGINNIKTSFLMPLVDGIVEINKVFNRSLIGVNLTKLQNLLGFNETERNVIEAAMLQTIDTSVMVFMRYFEISTNQRADMLNDLTIAMILDPVNDVFSSASVEDKLKEADKALDIETSIPLAFGMVNYNTRHKRITRLSEFWIKALTFDEAQDSSGFFNQFIREAKGKTSYSGALARIGDKDRALINQLITTVSSSVEPIEGCNVLLYGSRKLDKRTVVLDLLEGQVNAVYELQTKNLNSGDYPSVCLVAQKYLQQSEQSSGQTVLLVDNAEDALSKGGRKTNLFMSMMGGTNGKIESEIALDSDAYLLTKNKMLTIWLVNNTAALADEAVGRFLIHCEVKGGTRADRRTEVEKVVKELNLPPELAVNLAKYYELGSHQIRSAARVATLFNTQGSEAEALILQSVENSQRALGRENVEEIRESITKYDLGLLNLSGRFKPDELIKALKNKQQGTLCFYGLPGTGKTQLAEYIAMQLDKPLLIKRASDILSMWLGEAEQNIKKMFDEAKSEGAILLLDEADSFIRDRSLARASHEVTMVNELLTRMERFNGVFICATNLFEQLDAAALRRFTFKLEFHALSEEQRIKMFANETGLTLSQDDELWFDLLGIRFLTPGDFATVKRQADLLGIEMTPKQWMEQLQIEARAKLAGISRYGPSNDELVREITTKPLGTKE